MPNMFGFAWRWPELWEGIFRAGDLKGDLPDAIGTELGVSLQALDLSDPEYLWLRRTARYHSGIRIPAPGAGVFAQAALYPGSGAPRCIAQVDYITVSNPGAAAITVLFQARAPAIAVAQVAAPTAEISDDRIPPFNVAGGLSYYSWRNVNNAAAVTSGEPIAVALPAGSSLLIPFAPTLTNRVATSTPSFVGLLVQAAAANVALDVGAAWRERMALTSEIS